jgi:hypothetical protein
MPGEPSVRIRDLKRDRVNFVLENVDLALVLAQVVEWRNPTDFSMFPVLLIRCDAL